jgi:hypothetical protein
MLQLKRHRSLAFREFLFFVNKENKSILVDSVLQEAMADSQPTTESNSTKMLF